MKIKTYPIQFTEGNLRQIEMVAGKGNIKKFIYDAIDEKLENDSKLTKAQIDELLDDYKYSVAAEKIIDSGVLGENDG